MRQDLAIRIQKFLLYAEKQLEDWNTEKRKSDLHDNLETHKEEKDQS